MSIRGIRSRWWGNERSVRGMWKGMGKGRPWVWEMVDGEEPRGTMLIIEGEEGVEVGVDGAYLELPCELALLLGAHG
ncbi:hypothetical protein DEO72_LG9g1417 [Vigna unguiculata]|uniref:Uncharacterized protein n=1 Tax=Vigna unguiculata TaxID=3917 RepID=A0A4D6N2U5_VIGUN|nr:hypothetical protein DEO72_LG9g1417 [Vigna unguiculata]